MERARQRRSRSTTSIEFEGIQRIQKRIQKQEAISKLYSESHPYIDGTTRKDMFMLESGYSSPIRATGIQMKKLLAEEKPKEVEAKRRSPRDMPILISLDGQQRSRSLDSYRLENASMRTQSSSQLSDGHSSRRSSMKKLAFKDVYEDLEASHVTNRHYSSIECSSSRLTQSEMALFQQKFMDAKCLSMDAKLQRTKQFDDALEMLDSNTNLMLKFLQKPDSLCAKHLHDLKVHPPSQITVLKPSNSAKCEGNVKAWESERHISCKHDFTCDEKREDRLLLHLHSRHRAHVSCKSKVHSKENDEKITLPTRIVVLKPNLRKMHNTGNSPSQPDYSHGFLSNVRKLKEYPIDGGAETQSLGGKESSDDMRFLKPCSREARIIARGIANNITHGCDGRIDLMSSRVRGYAGDESSCDAYESDSGSESDVFKVSSRNSFCHYNWCEYSSSDLLKSSSISREAKKRLSERWKTGHKYKDIEMVAKVSTLGEMLAIPESETELENVNAKVDLDRECDRLARNNGTVDWPSGISSRDGWNNKLIKSSSRSKSLPPSENGRIHRRSAHCDAIAEDKYLMHMDSLSRGRRKTVKGNLYPKEDFSLKNLTRSKKHLSLHRATIGETDSSLEARFEIQMETNLEKDPSEQQHMPQMATEDVNCTSPELTSKYSELSLKQSSSEVENVNTLAHNEPVPSFQGPHKGSPQQGTDPGSSENLLQADDPSPVSVLEFPFIEDVSSVSECFERVNAELHELRMQLHLLKTESQACVEAPTLISSKNDIAQKSLTVFEENNMLGAEAWKTPYVHDVLIGSGFEDSDLYMFRTTWYSPECPLSPWLFNDLEKKYNDEITGLRDERRLLFDRINSALLEVFQHHVDLYPWVMPKIKRANSTSQKKVVRDACQRLLTGHDFEAEGNVLERILDKEMQWLEFKGEIDEIGNEIEILLIDELITEFLCSF
ncbi:uncharacterized protein LOC111382397 [Olea europaea var. sylvestris]|uniref:uncharacterized protein LOC111382397 n=1 Tax=Olea europaea var. sylvestris TaxID=158386 RepID=UPI000C1D8001|nr:uncharacterized protein LOC111382397 [Olea europaea var. sylvestris]XP_022862132.1 uncharacterized protein LOC111382397 [Olea europaea var. sylvestris]XP_022862133.1 uncharacterized protein LOC111382397 [Olea europaea var. sylvestris]